MDSKRLFFAFEILAPGVNVNLHLTIAFLGNTDYQTLKILLPEMPLPPFKVGRVGRFSECLALSNVIAWKADVNLDEYHNTIVEWLRSNNFHVSVHKGPFLPHVTVSRRTQDWTETFQPLPFVLKDFHLFESLGSSNYKSLWSHSVLPPFEEIDHAADVAFLVRGENLSEIHKNARTALAFIFPPILSYFMDANVKDLDDVIIDLNELVTECDGKIGCPFKAVSFHGDLKVEKDQTLSWEMIIDV